MTEKIFKFFMYLLIPLVGVGAYFYIFPVYPDYEIPEEYFYTRFHDEGFDSPDNGFEEWKNFISGLNRYTTLIAEFDIYHACFLENDCNNIDQNLTQQEKRLYLESILGESEKMNEFQALIQEFLMSIKGISSRYDYISTLNFSPDSELGLAIGSEVIPAQQLQAFTRGIFFYADHVSNSEASSILIAYYKYLSWLSENLDDSTVGYLSLIELIDMIFEYINTSHERFSSSFKSFIFSAISDFEIYEGMIENAVKVEHLYKILLYESIQNETLLGSDTPGGFNPKTLLFYDFSDTTNLARKIDKNILEGNCDFELETNGRNFIGRTLLNMNHCFLFDAQFQKEADILEKRVMILDLLSN